MRAIFLNVMFYSPKIQRLVTPLRLQRRRHLRAIKLRRIERSKEQVKEYKCVLRPVYIWLIVSDLPVIQHSPREEAKGAGSDEESKGREVRVLGLTFN